MWANFQRIIELFTQKIVNKLSKIRVLGSGIRKKHIPDPGVKKAPDPGSGSATLHTVLRIRVQIWVRRIRMFLGLPDPDPFVREVWIRIRILQSPSKNSKPRLLRYFFLTSLTFCL
jgi:hypothetical protein